MKQSVHWSFPARLRNPSQFIRQVSSTFVVQVLVLALGVVTGAIIARWFGTEGKGVLQLVTLAPAMLGLFIGGGVNIANVHYLGTRRYGLTPLMVNSFWFAVFGTLLGAAVLFLLTITGWLAWLMPGVPLWLTAVAMLALPLNLLIRYWSSLLQGLQEIHLLNLTRIVTGLVNLALVLLLVVMVPLGYLGILYSSLLGSLFNLLLLTAALRRRGGRFLQRWDPAVFRETLGFGLRGHVGNILQYFNYRLDVFVVNFFLGPASVGIYSVATKLAELVWNFPDAVGFVIFPKAAATEARTMNRFTPTVFRWTLLISVVAGLLIALLGMPFIVLVYSHAFADAYLPMLALLPGVVLLGSARVLTNDIAGRGYPQYNSINAGLALILTVIFDFWLIPSIGLLGASIASTLAYTLTFVTALLFYLRVSRASAAAQPVQEE